MISTCICIIRISIDKCILCLFSFSVGYKRSINSPTYFLLVPSWQPSESIKFRFLNIASIFLDSSLDAPDNIEPQFCPNVISYLNITQRHVIRFFQEVYISFTRKSPQCFSNMDYYSEYFNNLSIKA